MFLKRNMRETDDFAKKRYLVVKEEKYFNSSRNNIVSRLPYIKILKMSAFQIIPISLIFFPPKTFSQRTRVLPPPPLTDKSAKNVIFFGTAPLTTTTFLKFSQCINDLEFFFLLLILKKVFFAQWLRPSQLSDNQKKKILCSIPNELFVGLHVKFDDIYTYLIRENLNKYGGNRQNNAIEK